MERAVIIVKGRVQRAGYRDFIDETAFNLNLTGRVKNLKDGSVEIICEGPKKSILDFIKKVKINQYPIRVETLDVKFSEAKGEYKDFQIIRKENTNTVVYERMDIAAKYMREMNKDLGEKIVSGNNMLGEKIDSGNKILGEKIDSGNKMLGEKIDSGNKILAGKMDNVGDKLGSFHNDTAKRFDTLDVKYGAISENMKSLMERMDRNAEQTEKTIEALVEQQKEFNASVKGLTSAILKLAEKRT